MESGVLTEGGNTCRLKLYGRPTPKSERSSPTAGLRPAEGLWPPERPSPSCRPSAYGRTSPCERLPGRPSASGLQPSGIDLSY